MAAFRKGKDTLAALGLQMIRPPLGKPAEPPVKEDVK